jgi:hypothetical protein
MEQLCRAYALRMNGNAFSHLTAARLWNMPMPLYIGAAPGLHVSATAPSRAPTGRGVIGHQLSLGSGDVVSYRGIRVTSPATTWTLLGEDLDAPDLLAVADFIVTGSPFDRVPALASLDELAAAASVRGSCRGAGKCRLVLPDVRVGPRSRPESLVCLIVSRAGIPEPAINRETRPGGAKPDLSWPRYKVGLEYEGDYHRGVHQYRADIRRIEGLVDDDWLMTKASADDVFDRPQELAARIARRLAQRGWTGQPDLRRIGQFRR